MNSRERVMTALAGRQPDRVPYCELGIDRALAQQLMGWDGSTSHVASMETNAFTVDEAISLADRLDLDNLTYVLRAPVYAERIPGEEGRLFYGPGQIRSRDDLGLLELPDPEDDQLYAEAEEFTRRKGDRAAWFVTRLGIFPTMLSMGIEHFCLAVYDDRPFVEELLDRYTDWSVAVAKRVCQLDFDVYVSTDDMAFNTGPFFSPELFRDLVVPRMRRVAENITRPWIIHSDGNIMPFLPDLLSLGIAGLHPLEKGAMDIAAVKQEYGRRVCLLGNLDLNILGMGTPEDVDAEVRWLIETAGAGGGYIVTSGNSLAAYVKPENALALSQAVRRYGTYPPTGSVG